MTTANDGLRSALHITVRSKPEIGLRFRHPAYKRVRRSTSTWSPARQIRHPDAQRWISWIPCPPGREVRLHGKKSSDGSRRNATHGIVDPALDWAGLRGRLCRADAVVEPNHRVGRASIDRGEAQRAGHGDRSVGLTIQRIVRPTVRAVAVPPR